MAETYSPDNLIAGDFPIATDEVTILTGLTLARGAVLGKITASGKYKACDTSLSDGAETPEAVLAEAIVTTADTGNVPVYLTGAFNIDALSFGGTTSAADTKAGMRNKSMFQKAPVAD